MFFVLLVIFMFDFMCFWYLLLANNPFPLVLELKISFAASTGVFTEMYFNVHCPRSDQNQLKIQIKLDSMTTNKQT